MTITHNQLKEKLSLNYAHNGIDYIKNTSQAMVKILNHYHFQESPHTCDYAQKKATQYAQKYKINIQKCIYEKGYLDADSINLIETHLNSDTPQPIGFYAYDNIQKNHIEAFIVHDKKILFFKTLAHSDKIEQTLKNNFPQAELYTQKLIPKDDDENHYFSAYHYPQQDIISCPVFALKYLKECLMDNAKMLSDIICLDAGYGQSFKINEFIIHPHVERYSQSDVYYHKAKEYWKTHNKSTESNALLSQADAWRNQYDKSRMVYYLLKGLDKDMGYHNLETIKTDIINYKHDDNTHSNDEDNFF